YPRELAAGAAALVGGARAPIVGRVSMDMLMLDLSNCAHAEIGERAVLWGEGLRVDEVAARAGTLAHALLSGLGARVRRISVERIDARI
ncbi:MAG: alanine racemase, partial [Gammaproteobacteria bacterium]